MFTNASAAVARGVPALYLLLVLTTTIGIPPLYLLLGSAVAGVLAAAVLRVTQPRMKCDVRAGLARGANAEPFSVLLSSRPVRDVRGAVRSTIWSVVAHACFVVALVFATMTSADDGDYVILCILPVPESIPLELPPLPWGVDVIEHDFIFGLDGPESGRADGTAGAPPHHDLASTHDFMPRSVEPELANTAEVQDVMLRTYPPLLRDAGIGGTVLMWFLIDENGKVVKTQLKESSGHPALDEAAAALAEVMVFRPALNLDQRVPVWAAIPIRFVPQ